MVLTFSQGRKFYSSPYQIWGKMTLFRMKVFINNFLTLHLDCYDSKRVKCIPSNNTSTNKPPWRDFYLKKTGQMGYFQFFRFWRRFAYISILPINYWYHHQYDSLSSYLYTSIESDIITFKTVLIQLNCWKWVKWVILKWQISPIICI